MSALQLPLPSAGVLAQVWRVRHFGFAWALGIVDVVTFGTEKSAGLIELSGVWGSNSCTASTESVLVES